MNIARRNTPIVDDVIASKQFQLAALPEQIEREFSIPDTSSEGGRTDSDVVLIGNPTFYSLEAFAHRIRIQEELALESETAVTFLAKLYDAGVLHKADLKRRFTFNDVTGVALLAAAGLCQVDPGTIRISERGYSLANGLLVSSDDFGLS